MIEMIINKRGMLLKCRFFHILFLALGMALLPLEAVAKPKKKKKKTEPTEPPTTEVQPDKPAKPIHHSKKETKDPFDSPPPPKDKEEPSPATGFGLGASFAYESLAVNSDGVEQSVDGYGFRLIGLYSLAPTPKVVLQTAGGFEMLSMSGSSDIVTVDVKMNLLSLEVAGLYMLTSKLGLGALLGYDYGLGGTVNLSVIDGQSYSQSITAANRILFGARGLFFLSPGFSLGGDFELANGSYTSSKDDGSDSSLKFSGNVLRLIALYSF